MGGKHAYVSKSVGSQEPTIEDLDEGILVRIFEYVFGEPFHAWDSVFGRRFEENEHMEPTCIDGFAHGLVLSQVGLTQCLSLIYRYINTDRVLPLTQRLLPRCPAMLIFMFTLNLRQALDIESNHLRSSL